MIALMQCRNDWEMLGFACTYSPDDEVTSIVPEGPWLDVVRFSPKVVKQADPRFLRHGDGLITIYTRDEIVTYGVVGEARTEWFGPSLHARLLSIRPRALDEAGAS